MLPLPSSRPKSWIKGFFPTSIIAIQFLLNLPRSLSLIPTMPPTRIPYYPYTPRPIYYSSRYIVLIDYIARTRFKVI